MAYGIDGFDDQQVKQTRWMVWGALLSSQVIYVGVSVAGLGAREEPLELLLFPIILGFLAAGTALGAHFCWRRAVGAHLAVHEARPEPASAFAGYILAWALDESIAIYGLVLALLAFQAEIWACFSAASLALFLIHRPR